MSEPTVEVKAGLPRNAAEWGEIHHSVFAKLLISMVAMGACLLILVGTFFWFIVGPNLHSSVDRVMVDYTRSLAARSLSFADAKELHDKVNIEIRYMGPAGDWATSQDMPSIEEVRQNRIPGQRFVLLRRSYYLEPSPDGGSFLFAWSLGQRMKDVHSALLASLALAMVVVVITTYIVLKSLLRPLSVLNEGVISLSQGKLDVVLPNRTRDEFGRLTGAFNQMASRVRAMVKSRDQLLLDVSHELRSPVTRLKVALELLPPGPQRTGMMSDAAEMERMIAELLELERLRSGHGLRIARHDLSLIVHEVADGFRDKHPGVHVSALEQAFPADIDEEKVRSVLRNLLENSAKYSLPRSRPTEISLSETSEAILLRVADDGPGIPPADMDLLFEPFYRADRSRSKMTGGYGLGLSICKRVMQSHGGDIVLEPSAGGGATFLLTFPKTGARKTQK